MAMIIQKVRVCKTRILLVKLNICICEYVRIKEKIGFYLHACGCMCPGMYEFLANSPNRRVYQRVI